MTIKEEEHLVDLEMEAVSLYLIWIFLMFYNEKKSCRTIKITSKKLQNEEEVEQNYQKNPEVQGFKIISMTGINKKNVEKIKEALMATFISEEVLSRMLGLFECLESCYNNYSDDVLLCRREHIAKFLDTYYDILVYFLCENELLETEGFVEKILIPTLNLGIVEVKSETEYKAGMTMPVVLHAMDLVYNKLDEFLLLSASECDEIASILYKEIFLAKLHQIFRFYVIREKNGSLYHGALPAFRKSMDHSEMGVPVRSISTYNSFQGIRELRLADKILFEIKQKFDMVRNQKEAKGEFIYHITIFGDVVREAMNELLMYIQKQIALKEEFADMQDVRIKFKVYTMRAKEEEELADEKNKNEKYVYNFYPYSRQLLNRKDLNDILEEGDLFFFLDNCDLYRTEVAGVDDIITFKQYISFGSHRDYKTQYIPDDLVLNSKFMDLYHTLTMYAWKNEIGFLKKKAKEDLIKFIRDKVESRAGKSAYIYISDIDAFEEMACIQENIVRIETYNQKEIGIIRFTNYPREELSVFFELDGTKNGLRKQLLVFNMWQLVKHIVLNQKVNFERLFLKGQRKNMLDQIYIALDYSNWREAVRVSYYYREPKRYRQEKIEKFIDVVIQKMFVSDKKDMYQTYLKKVFISILYGAAKSVEDLLFVHILKKKEDIVGRFLWRDSKWKGLKAIGDRYDSSIEYYYNLNCKYSLKKITGE